MYAVRGKKFLRLLGILSAFIIGVNLLLYLCGWHSKKVEGRYGNIYAVLSDSSSSDRLKSRNVYGYFYVFDGLDMGYDVSISIEKGKVELNILEADDVKMIYDGLRQPVAATKTMETSDKFFWDLSTLPKEHRYALAVYGSDGAIFFGEITQHYSRKNNRKWQEAGKVFLRCFCTHLCRLLLQQ